MQIDNKIIISFLGSVGAGKSTLIKSFLNHLKKKNINFEFFGIDETRKEIWEKKGKPAWSWEDEDDAYAQIFSNIENTNCKLIILETTGLAKRMQRAHRLLAVNNNLYTVKVSCDPETCAQRHATRDKDMSEYPPLPLQNTIEEGIYLMADDLQMLNADLILDSLKHEVEKNTELIWNWFTKLNTKNKQKEKPKNYVTKYLAEKKFPKLELKYQTQLFDIAHLISAQNKNIRILACAKELILNQDNNKIEFDVYNCEQEELKNLLENCFGTNLRVIYKRKISFLIKTSAGEEIKINHAARELFLGGTPYKSVEEYAKEADFTVNTIYIDPIKNTFVDPLNCIEDLKNLTLKSPDFSRYKKHSKTLIDIYQAIQLTARYGFKLDAKLLDEFKKLVSVSSLASISAFFTAEELLNILNQPKYLSSAIELMRELGTLQLDFPEIYELYLEEALNKKPLWTNTLTRLDKIKDKNYAIYFATMLFEVPNLTSEKIEQILGIFQAPERVIANTCVCLIQRKNLIELKKIIDTSKPVAAKPAKTQLRLQPKPQNSVDELREPVQKFFASFWPLTIEEFYSFLELVEDKKFSDYKNFILDLLKKYKIDPDYRMNLVTKKMLLNRFKNIKGETISILLEEVDKQRLKLLTPERALNYLEENFPRLVN